MLRSADARRVLVLTLLTLLTAVHPFAGSGRASGHSLAHWMKALLCVCEHCGRSAPSELLEPVEPAAAGGSCCSDAAQAAPARVPRADANQHGGCAEQCACTHPLDLPLSEEAPLGAPRDGGGDEPGALLSGLASAADAAAARPANASAPDALALRAEAALAPPRARAHAARARAHAARFGARGARPRLARGPNAYLALLCTALI